MNKWYKKTTAKAVIFLLAVLSGAAFVTSLIGALTIAGTANPAELWHISDKAFEDSDDFNALVENSMMEVLQQLRLENLFETDGAYNPDKVIDIIEYSKSDNISGEDVSGVAYTLDELENWSEDYANGEGDIYDDNGVIVCEKPDGSYYYYYLNDFLTLFENGRLVLEMEEGADPDMFLKGLGNGGYTTKGPQ